MGFGALAFLSVQLVKTGWIPWEFFPKVEGEILTARLEMPLGAPFSETQEAIKRLEAAALQLGAEIKDNNGEPVVTNLLATAGMQPFLEGFSPDGPPTGTHLGEVTLELAAAKDRDISTAEFKVKWQELVGEAAVRAGARRFRPILLTSLTTFAGLMPMLLETDMQAKFLIPMAVSLGFGILFATTITLILVPSIYLILDDVLNSLRRLRGLLFS